MRRFNGFAFALVLCVLLTPPVRFAAATEKARTPGRKPFASTIYKPPSVRATVKPYKVAPGMTNVVNLRQMNRYFRFSPQQKQMLVQNGFVVTPSNEEQLFFIYENNDYLELPSFVSTDSVLQVYHVFYDYTLRQIEQTKLIKEAAELSRGLVEASKSQFAASTETETREAARRNLAFATIALKLLETNTAIDPAVADIVTRELSLIDAHAGREVSPTFPDSGIRVDYSQFVPRGHYTRTPELQKYFRAMMWYGLMPFPLENAMSGDDEMLITRQALLLTAALFDTRESGKQRLIEHWDRVYAPTAFYVGVADDLTPFEYQQLASEVFGTGPALRAIETDAKMLAFIAEGRKRFRAPGIAASIGDDIDGTVQARQFRLMGQRFVLDSRVFQELTYPKVGTSDKRRLMPNGLDVMGALGSERAKEILAADPEATQFANYDSQMAKMRAEITNIDQQTWNSNLYYSWLWTLQALLQPAPEGYPAFMKTKAWQDKSLSTALGSWAELKHDTVLYGKQAGAECGSGEEPPLVRGYVEPNVELYARLRHLTVMSREGLVSRGLIESEESVDTAFQSFDDLLLFLQRVSEKELQGIELTREEYDQIRYYGSQLEILTLSVIDEGLTGWFEIESETDRNMALIADVFTGGSNALQTGVGPAYNVFAVVPMGGKLYLTRGAVFSYFEFGHPASDRLTDEAWQGMLKNRKAPPQPAWMRTFLSGATVTSVRPADMKNYSSGC